MAENNRNVQDKLRERLKSNGSGRNERDLNDITQRLQHQVNELVERVTGIRQVKRQYFTLGLTVGAMAGLLIGLLVGTMNNATKKDTQQQ
jgi:tetrahydromethanopterin S-methyltransferase subunit G